MDEQDRIRLVKAMEIGIVKSRDGRIIERDSSPSFDPFTDANDDYVVLEWMRQNDEPLAWRIFHDALGDFPKIGYKSAYQIGDYARAALKVLE